MPNIYISIVSHGNDDDLINNSNLLEINCQDKVTVIVRDNTSSSALRAYCKTNNLEYRASVKSLGFGANNNKNFQLALELGMKSTDWFILLNPDLDISANVMNNLYTELQTFSNELFAINLFFDREFSEVELSLRYFPTFISFFNILKRKPFTEPYDKNKLLNGSVVDWSAGSCLVFKSDLYNKLEGFDESYFMYFEDVDICHRAKFYFHQEVVYLKNIKAVHKGGYKNRDIFSKHFQWYISSLLRFLFKSTLRKLR